MASNTESTTRYPGSTPEAGKLKAIVEDGYDAIADKYFAWATPRPAVTRNAYVGKLMALLPPTASVLELGCGPGIPAAQMFADAGLNYTGVDISAAQIALAKEKVKSDRAAFVHADMMAFEAAPNSYDAAVGFYSLFHLPREELGTMIGKIAGWLKPGGYLLFNTGSNEGDVVREDWMGAKMFSTGLGVEGNREVMRERKELQIVEDELEIEVVGSFKETFHWILAKKIND